MLDPTSRFAIIIACGLCAAATVTFSPAPAHALGDVQLALRSALTPATIGKLAEIPVRRDPFAPPAAPHDALAAAPAIAPAAAVTGSNAILPLPSNLATDTIPAIPGAVPAPAAADGVRITAVTTGAHPYALVEIGGVHAIKGIGDRIAGVPISAIDLDGIRLQSGERLRVNERSEK